MKIVELNVKDALLFESPKYVDQRGYFFESYSEKTFRLGYNFVQDNQSSSTRNVLRGLHYQIKNPQGKLVRCIRGSVLDTIVDLRQSSETFGEWYSVKLDRPELQLWVPPGFAHGFSVLSPVAEVLYKVTDYQYKEYERTLLWNDEQLNIDWQVGDSIMSEKDKKGVSFKECDKYE